MVKQPRSQHITRRNCLIKSKEKSYIKIYGANQLITWTTQGGGRERLKDEVYKQ